MKSLKSLKMRTTDTYENEIKQKYLNDKEQGLLRGNLHNLTPSSIRKVCLNIYDETTIDADILIIKNFFLNGKEEPLRQKICAYDLDCFRPIRNFLLGGTSTIKSHDTLELTALIVDFKPRPYNKYRQSHLKNKVNDKVEGKTDNLERSKNETNKKDKKTIEATPTSNSSNQAEKIENNSKKNCKSREKEIININNRGGSYCHSNTKPSLTTPSIVSFNPDTNPSTNVGFNSNIKIIIISSIILLFIVFVIIPLNKTKWMVWQNDHYIETSFDLEKYNLDDLKLYKKERIEHFKKIESPSCTTFFFKANGSENVWYGKNSKGELEYFTDLGLHPETGKTLKKITKYMIKTHICPEYK
jgi:hypothetical protein